MSIRDREPEEPEPVVPEPVGDEPVGDEPVGEPGSDDSAGCDPGRPRPGRFRRLVLRPAMWLLALLAVTAFVLQLLLDTTAARRAIADAIASRLGERLERRVEIEDLRVHLLPFSVEVWGFAIHGPSEMDSDLPFIEIPWAEVEADLSALQRRVLELRQVRIERPRVYIDFLVNGDSNILTLRRQGPPKPRRFDVHIDRIEVDRAEFLLDQESVQMSISADAVRARFEGLGDLHVGGQLAAQNVSLRLPNARPYFASVTGQGSIQRGLVKVDSAHISGPRFDAEGAGSCSWPIDDPRDKQCEFEARGDGQGELLADLGYFPHLRGPFRFDGTLGWRPGAFGWRSRVTAPRLEIWDREITDLDGVLGADRYRVRLSIDRARYGDGDLTGVLDIAIREPERPMTVALELHGVLADQVLADQHIPAGAVASRLAGNVVYRFPLKEGNRGSGYGEIEVTADRERPGLPLAGSFPLRIETGVVRTDAVNLSGSRQSILANGYYDVDRREGLFDYEVASADVAELIAVLDLVKEGQPWPPWLPTSGEGQLAGTLELGAGGEVATDVRLRLEKVRGTVVDTPQRLSGGFRVDRLAVEPFRVQLADGASALMMHGRIPLRPDDPRGIELDFDAFEWPLATVKPWLAFELPLDGRISGRLHLRVEEAGSSGRLSAAVKTARFLDLPLDSIAGQLHWDTELLSFDEVTFTAPAGQVLGHGTLRWPSTEGEGESLDIDLRASALEVSRAPLRRFLPRRDLAGEVAVTAHLGGRRDRPRLDLEIAADAIALGARRLQGRPSRLDLHWAEGRLEATGRLLDRVTIAGGGRLDEDGSDLAFEVEGHDLAGLIELIAEEPPADVDGRFHGELTIAGDVGLGADGAGDEASGGGETRTQLVLDSLEMSYHDRRLTNVEPIRAALEPDHLRIDSLYLAERATGSELFLAGRTGYDGSAPLDLRLQSSLDASWLVFVLPDLRVEGTFDLLARVGGSLDAPYLDGQGALRDARLVLAKVPDFPHTLENLGGVVLFYPQEIVLDHLAGDLAGGRLRMEGRSDVPHEGARLRYRLNLRGEDLRVHYPRGWVVAGGTELALRTLEPGESDETEGREVAYLIQGRADLSELRYTQDVPLGFAQVVQEALLRRRLEVSQASELLSAMQLDVVVEAPQALRVQNNLANLSGGADLALRGNLAEPILYGSVDLDPGGHLEYSSVDYAVERGRLTFANPYKLDPEVDLVATTRVRDFDVTLTLSGTVERLTAGFSSEPPLPALEVFRLLSTGPDEALEANPLRRAGELGDEQSMSAASFLYGQAASVIGERVSNLFGFDKFRIDPLTGSGDTLSKARVTVGKRLSKDVFVSYSADPASTEEQRLQIEWQLGHGIVLVLTQNGDNSYEADARWETSF